jgi:hypothetical protein
LAHADRENLSSRPRGDDLVPARDIDRDAGQDPGRGVMPEHRRGRRPICDASLLANSKSSTQIDQNNDETHHPVPNESNC